MPLKAISRFAAAGIDVTFLSTLRAHVVFLGAVLDLMISAAATITKFTFGAL